jgi:GNAT superfamily N-acetyltransferase
MASERHALREARKRLHPRYGLRVESTHQPRDEDVQFLDDRINEHNMVRTGRRDYLPLAVFQRGEHNEIIAGLYGYTWAGWLEIRLVWVRDDLRGQGYGRRLVEAAEAEARIRGCKHIWLDSFTFQAPAFYQKLGYEVFGTLAGFPPPDDRVFLTKTL